MRSALACNRFIEDDATPISERLGRARLQLFPNTLPELLFCPPGHPQRPFLEQLIQQRFAKQYSADIRDFHPYLIGLRQNGHISVALGFRPASASRLFLEQYLDDTIERKLSAIAGVAVARETIVELGNLAAEQTGYCHLLFILTAAFIARSGFDWIVFSATIEVRNIFQRLDLYPIAIAGAEQHYLTSSCSSWGSYYAKQPQVMAGYVPAGYRTLRENRFTDRFLLQSGGLIDDLCRQYRAAVEQGGTA